MYMYIKANACVIDFTHTHIHTSLQCNIQFVLTNVQMLQPDSSWTDRPTAKRDKEIDIPIRSPPLRGLPTLLGALLCLHAAFVLPKRKYQHLKLCRTNIYMCIFTCVCIQMKSTARQTVAGRALILAP